MCTQAYREALIRAHSAVLGRCPDEGVDLAFREEHGELPGRGQRPVAGLGAELARYPQGILDRPAPDPGPVLDRKSVV